MPFFSIIIPAYNAARSIKAALDSVKEQSFQDFELIVINDGSTDSTVELLQQWKQQHPGVKFEWRNQPNRGLGNARNRGIQIANGTFIALLDADDLWEKSKLWEVYGLLQNKPDAEAVFHQVRTTGLKKNRVRKAYLPRSIEELLIRGNPIVPSAFVMERHTFRNFAFSEKPAFHGAEDLHLWIRLLITQTKMVYLPRPLTLYHENMGMSARLGEHLRKVENVLEYFYQGEDISKALYHKALHRKQYEAARFCHKRGLFRKAEDYYQAARMNSLKIWCLRILNFFGIAL